jgi:hypothetical protein
MIGTQLTLDKTQFKISNAALVVEDRPAFDPVEEGWGYWLPDWLAALQQANLAKARSEVDDLTALSVFFFIDYIPTYGTMTIQMDMTIGLVHKEGALEEDILIDEPLPRLPARVQPVKLRLITRGRGKPTFRLETEIDLYDD